MAAVIAPLESARGPGLKRYGPGTSTYRATTSPRGNPFPEIVTGVPGAPVVTLRLRPAGAGAMCGGAVMNPTDRVASPARTAIVQVLVARFKFMLTWSLSKALANHPLHNTNI
jgi:hypothetical protein